MCGIFFTCSSKEHVDPDESTRSALQARGPDSLKIYHIQVPSQANGTDSSSSVVSYFLTFASSVLSLRGERICAQPLVDSRTGSVLCWNGEAWKIDDVSVRGNDTEHIFRLLLDASGRTVDEDVPGSTSQNEIPRVLTRVTGPYSFVYYDATTSRVWFGRDKLGRRSLVLDQATTLQPEFTISSINLKQQPAVEVTTDGIHFLDLRQSALTLQHSPWLSENPHFNKSLPENEENLPRTPSSVALAALEQHLLESIRLRVVDVPTYTSYAGSSLGAPSKIAVLFSGGLDCTLLARLAHDLVPTDQPIDLLNVAFENPRSIRAAKQSVKPSAESVPEVSHYETCPDRITARSSFLELATTCPNRTWRFVSIDVPYSETLKHRPTVVKLMSPHNTEMDLSIAIALYFASRGQGQATTSSSPTSTPKPYTTTSRVLLSGLGADELFGGYARHAVSFTRAGWDGLTSELELDFNRIGSRNLGRDDRVMAHWGREVRYPYLDENFVAFALSLNPWDKVGFRTGQHILKHFEGTGEKILVEKEEDLDPAKMALRLVAWKLGMKGVAGEKKRAIQFGARTAKMEGGRTKGTDLLAIVD